MRHTQLSFVFAPFAFSRASFQQMVTFCAQRNGPRFGSATHPLQPSRINFRAVVTRIYRVFTSIFLGCDASALGSETVNTPS